MTMCVCVIIIYCSWWDLAVRKAKSIAKYLIFGLFIILLDRLHQNYCRNRTSSSSSDIHVMSCTHDTGMWYSL